MRLTRPQAEPALLAETSFAIDGSSQALLWFMIDGIFRDLDWIPGMHHLTANCLRSSISILFSRHLDIFAAMGLFDAGEWASALASANPTRPFSLLYGKIAAKPVLFRATTGRYLRNAKVGEGQRSRSEYASEQCLTRSWWQAGLSTKESSQQWPLGALPAAHCGLHLSPGVDLD